MMLERSKTMALGLALALPLTGAACSSMSNTQRGAVIGAAGGAAVGGVIGRATGNNTARGAIIGAAVGGTAGAIIGSQMDKQGEELAREIPDATVERVGEGLLVTFDSGLLFAFDSDRIQGEAQRNLDNLAESIREYPNTEILIVGHTDSVGTDSYNQGLSERRARSAADYLVGRGVRRDRLRTAGRGETEPVRENSTEAGRAENRRVEVAIFASEEYREQLQRRGG